MPVPIHQEIEVSIKKRKTTPKVLNQEEHEEIEFQEKRNRINEKIA